MTKNTPSGWHAAGRITHGLAAAALLERSAESRLALDPFGPGVDIREADLDVLGPEWHQAPAHHVQAARAGPCGVADGRERVPSGQRSSWARCSGPMRRDRDEFDLADIGGEAGAATHDTIIASPDRRQKAMDRAKRPCHSSIEQTGNIMAAS